MTEPGTGMPNGGGRLANWLSLLVVIASLSSVVVALISSQRDLALSIKGQLADRFSSTVELLSSDGTEKRLGGIYALEQIAKESPEYRAAVKNALAGFVRVSSRQLGPECGRVGLADSPDLAAAVAILADQIPEGMYPTAGRWANDATSFIDPAAGRWVNDATSFIDLTGACLHARNLERSRLNYARLNGADIGDSAFDGASLRHARLGASGSEIMTNGSDYVAYIESIKKNLNIAGASFRKADLRDSDLSSIWVRRSCGPRPSLWFDGAYLTGATMWQSAIPDAVFVDANMDGMTITASSFVGAEFDADTSLRDVKVDKWINFEQADLRAVDLKGLTFVNPLSGQPWPKINFRNANLRGADLRGLDLVDAEFSGADLREAKLDGPGQLAGARWDGWTLWPDDVRPTAEPAAVPSQPPPRKPDPPADRADSTPAMPVPDPDERVTIETSPEGAVRIEIAPQPSPQRGTEGAPPRSDQPDLDPPTTGADRTYGNYNDIYSPPYYNGNYYYYYNNTFYSDYSGLNYIANSEIFTAC